MEDILKSLVHQRGAVKGKVTTIVQTLERGEDDLAQVSLPLLKVFSKKLELHYAEYCSLHKEVIAVSPAGKLDEQDLKLTEFEQLHTDAMVRLECLMDRLSTTSGAQPTVAVGQQPVIIQQQPLKAPIPTFDGRYENWPRFKAMFTDIITRCADSDAIKLHHLEKSLIGAAAGIIDSRTLADNNFSHAWEMLKERYENPRVIVDTHIGGLLSMKKCPKNHTLSCENCSTRVLDMLKGLNLWSRRLIALQG